MSSYLSAINILAPGVDEAENESEFGHHCGPLVHPNPSWLHKRHRDHEAKEGAKGSRPVLSAGENAKAPNALVKISRVNGGVCWISAEDEVMCGVVVGQDNSIYQHARRYHGGAIAAGSPSQLTTAEIQAGVNSLVAYCRSGGWRNASFLKEPSAGPDGGVIHTICNRLEAHAAENEEFATKYGNRFHRDNKIRKSSKTNSSTTYQQLLDAGFPRPHLHIPGFRLVPDTAGRFVFEPLDFNKENICPTIPPPPEKSTISPNVSEKVSGTIVQQLTTEQTASTGRKKRKQSASGHVPSPPASSPAAAEEPAPKKPRTRGGKATKAKGKGKAQATSSSTRKSTRKSGSTANAADVAV